MTVCDKALQWLPLIQAIVLTIGVLITFSLSYANGHVSIYVPFISETGAIQPEMCIFSLFLIIGSFLGAIIVYFRYCIMETVLADADSINRRLNWGACFIGLGSMAGLAGVAAFPVSTIFYAHLTAAGIHFTLAMVYMIVHTYLSYCTPGYKLSLKRLRVVLSLLVFVFLSFFAVLFPVAFRNWISYNKKIPAHKSPADHGFGLMITTALLEWLMYISFLLFMTTFIVEFIYYRLSVFAVQVECTSVPFVSYFVCEPKIMTESPNSHEQITCAESSVNSEVEILENNSTASEKKIYSEKFNIYGSKAVFKNSVDCINESVVNGTEAAKLVGTGETSGIQQKK